MQTEIEAKWLRIDPAEIRKKLTELGATLEMAERLMRRRIYDYPDRRLDKINGWIRVRDEGDKVTMSYKQMNERTVHGTKEVNVVVGDFELACNFLDSIGMQAKSYQETRRESWTLDGTEIEIDTWPWIPTFVEVEAKDEAALRATASKLGLSWHEALHGGIEPAYQAYYDATEQEINTWDEIIFGPVPDWLQKKAK